MRAATHLLHSIPVDELTGAISVPIYQTSTFVQEAPGINRGFDFSRGNNPTRRVLENLVSTLEEGYAGFAFSSGLAAIDAILKLLKSGDEILAGDDTYGGIFQLFSYIFQKLGLKVTYVDTSDPGKILEKITERTRMICFETPTNPTLKISDIRTVCKLAHQHNILVTVDNTFASPVSQKPLTLGADIVIHSATKYLAGHSDVVAGVVVVNAKPLAEQIKFIQNISGTGLSPFDAWLTIRGMETLHLRMEKQSSNALTIAKWLEEHPAVDKVFYPGLSAHKNHHIAKKQQKYFGGMISFSLREDSIRQATKLVNATRLFKLAESLGGVKSMLSHPVTMTHKAIPEDFRKRAGVQDSLIRLSVGIEDPDDLVADLSQAMENLSKQKENSISIQS